MTTYLKIDSDIIKKVTSEEIFSCGEQQIILKSLMNDKRLSKKNYEILITDIMKKNDWL